MLDIIENHLRNTVPAEQLEEYLHIDGLLQALNVDSDEYHSDLMMQYGGGTVERPEQMFYDGMYNDMHSVFRQHGISMSLEASLSQMTPVLEFFVNVENTEFIQELADEANNTEVGVEERFAECVSIVTGRSVDEILPYVTDVPFTVILGIQRYTAQRLATQGQEGDYKANENAMYILALTTFVKEINGANMRCYEHATVDGVQLGMPLEYYWQLYRDYLITIPLKAMVYEMIGFCIISDRNDSDPMALIMPVVNQYYGDDIDKSSEIQTAVRQTLMNLQTSANSGLFQKVGVI